MHVLLTATALVALAEIGDKTQLLSFVLAARLRRPLPIIAGIFAATIANHLVAASAGVALVHVLSPRTLPWLVGAAFIGFGLWTLRPDTPEDRGPRVRRGAFVTTLIAFFLAEMGDKTQLATVALAARYDALVPVVAGTTIGMLLANIPAVLIGEALATRLPMRAIRWVAAGLFLALGVATLVAKPKMG